jgi:hypothetical protein
MMVTIKSPEGEILVVDEADLSPPSLPDGEQGPIAWESPYPGWVVVAEGAPASDTQSFVNGAWVDDLEKIKAAAMESINRFEADAVAQMAQLTTALATCETWRDIKKAEQDIADNKVPADTQGQAERYPFLWGISQVAGITMVNALSLAKTFLIADMQEIALAGARALVARYNAANATTAAQVEDAVSVAEGSQP